MLSVGMIYSSNKLGFTGIDDLVLLEINFSFGDARSSGVFLCSRIARYGSSLISSILFAWLTAASAIPFPFG